MKNAINIGWRHNYILLVLCGLIFTACSQPADDKPTTVAVTGVTLDKSSLTMTVGGTAPLVPTIEPSNATNKNVSWTSSNNSVATVSNGTVTAVAPGSAIIIVTTEDGNKSADCAVTVEAATIAVTGVTLDQSSLTMSVGGTAPLVPTVEPSNATNKNVSWTSSNNSVATVSNGTVTAVAPGSATITVTTADGNKTATCAVTVNNSININIGAPAVELYLDSGTTALQEGGTTTIAIEAPKGTFTVSIASGSYTNIVWYINGSIVAQGASKTSYTLPKRTAATYLVTVEATPVGGGKDFGSHSFVVQ